MPKKGGKKKKKTAGLPEQFWTMMPPPGSFDHRTRQWISSDPDRSQRDLLETEVLKAVSDFSWIRDTSDLTASSASQAMHY
jgi:hypothetical protein